jgi:hypothetical protein
MRDHVRRDHERSISKPVPFSVVLQVSRDLCSEAAPEGAVRRAAGAIEDYHTRRCPTGQLEFTSAACPPKPWPDCQQCKTTDNTKGASVKSSTALMLWVLQCCSVDAGNSRTLFSRHFTPHGRVVHFALRTGNPVNLWPRSQARQHNTRGEKKTLITIASLSWKISRRDRDRSGAPSSHLRVRKTHSWPD